MILSRIFVACVALGMHAPVPAQTDIYADPQNLTVLPQDTSSESLRSIMRSFALDTGFRCSSCHIGEEGQALSKYDFASDDKELKGKARLMLKMVNTINSNHLAEIGEERIEVHCVTCHRGVNKPELTGDILGRAADEGGVDGMKAEYQELREHYYGSHSYDFTDISLSDFARSRAAAGHLDEATAMLDLVLEDKPDSFMAHFSYAEIQHLAGNSEQAIEHYRKAIKANPDAAGFLQQRIQQLEAPPEVSN